MTMLSERRHCQSCAKFPIKSGIIRNPVNSLCDSRAGFREPSRTRAPCFTPTSPRSTEMRCLSLKTELSWLIGCLMLVTLLINLSISDHPRWTSHPRRGRHQRPLTRELVVTAIGSLQETDDPLPALNRFYESLGKLRHVDVKVLSGEEMPAAPPAKAAPDSQSSVPGWFVDLIHTPARILIVPVTIKGVDYGRIAIVSNPVDELEEIWSDVSLGLRL